MGGGKTTTQEKHNKTQQILSNYSGHHMKGSYQKQIHMGQQIINTKKTEKQQQKNKKQANSLAQGPPEPD